MINDSVEKLDKQDADKVLKKTVEKTIEAIAEYVEPGPRDAEATVEKVIETVDNDDVKAALASCEAKRERAVGIAKQDSFEKHQRRIVAQKGKEGSRGPGS